MDNADSSSTTITPAEVAVELQEGEKVPAEGGEGESATDAGYFGHGSRANKSAGGGGGVIAAPTSRDAVVYNMNHKRRGRAIIFNHNQFLPDQQMKARNGTDVDRDALGEVLNLLDFEVTIFNDLRKTEIYGVLDKLAAEDHGDADCLCVCFLSHGDRGVLYSYDDMFKSEQLWARFTADKCFSLAGKPKIFFIQACQGDQLDTGATMAHKRKVDTDGEVMSYKIPAHADFLLCFSTVPGYYSWRNTAQGSWFVQALTRCLRQYAGSLDLLSVMTRVNRSVATDFESNCPGDSSMHQRKQIPCINTMLTRDLFFTPKRR